MAAPLTGEQLRAFETSGYALLESPLTPDQLDSAEDAFDRLIQVRQTHSQAVLSQALATDPPFVELISHPWFESVAKQLLRSEQVRLIELGPSQFRPGTGESRSAEAEADNWRSGAHLDIQVSASGFDATPRQDMLACWFWVNDVPAERGAMRILPGSHRPIQEHFERTLTPEHRAMLPRHQVLRPQPSDTTQETWSNHPEYIPEPADFPFTECEPMPVVAKRGTAQFFTQSLLHSVRPPHPNPFRVHPTRPADLCVSGTPLTPTLSDARRPGTTQTPNLAKACAFPGSPLTSPSAFGAHAWRTCAECSRCFESRWRVGSRGGSISSAMRRSSATM